MMGTLLPMASVFRTTGLAALIAAAPAGAWARATLSGSFQADVRGRVEAHATLLYNLASAHDKASAGRRQQTGS